MAVAQKLSSFDPTKVNPKVLVVSCTADISYIPHLADDYFDGNQNPTRAVDYMEFLHPGAFPVDDSLDAIAEVMARFAIPELVIISHIDCGLVDALAKRAQSDQENPYLFSGYSKAVSEMLLEFEMSTKKIASLDIEEVTILLAKLVTNRVAKKIEQRSTLAKQELDSDEVFDKANCQRLIDLENCHIASYSFLGPEKGLTQIISRFHPNERETRIKF